MTANEHPISDAELDAVLGAATARLDETLARTVDVRAGLAAITGPSPSPRPEDTPEKANPADSAASRAQNVAPRSVSAQFRATLYAIDVFPRDLSHSARVTAGTVVALYTGLRQLDQQLARRAVGREDAQLVLQQADASLQKLLTRLTKVKDRTWPEPLFLVATTVLSFVGLFLAAAVGDHVHLPFVTTALFGLVPGAVASGFLVAHHSRLRRKLLIVSTQVGAVVRLRKSLHDLMVAVDHLFDDAEDRSEVPAGSC